MMKKWPILALTLALGVSAAVYAANDSEPAIVRRDNDVVGIFFQCRNQFFIRAQIFAPIDSQAEFPKLKQVTRQIFFTTREKFIIKPKNKLIRR